MSQTTNATFQVSYIKNEEKTVIKELDSSGVLTWLERFAKLNEAILYRAERVELEQYMGNKSHYTNFHLCSLWIGDDLIPYYLDKKRI